MVSVKARNIAGYYAYYNKYDCLVYMDAHMLILSDNYLDICKKQK